ncbi:hypothetical protein CHUAL_008461 [Chamberlinius hualienensis]
MLNQHLENLWAGRQDSPYVIQSFHNENPLILFSGDIFAPSMMSTFTKGEQMVPVLNACHVHCAVFGNHDFDFGIENLVGFTKQTNFPWLISNVIDNETKRPLAEGLTTYVKEWGGKKFGLLGLVEYEWLATLATIDPDEVTYLDFVQEGRKLARQLKDQQGVDYVIALTHMRSPNDVRLAENVDEIDLILGGHDHVYEVKKVNGKYIIKSGTDFRQMSKIKLTFNHSKVDIDIEEITVTGQFGEDEQLKSELEKYSSVVEGKMDETLCNFGVDLDGRFSSVRTSETNLGNFICDVMLSSTHADLAILNSGTLRSDMIHPKGEFKRRDLCMILPFLDPLMVLDISGKQIMSVLENGVSQYPKLEGRFPQVSGISFAFDPSKPPGERIDPNFIKIGDEYLNLDANYRLATKAYLQSGRDGYDVLKECEILQDDESSPELCTAVQNHFHAIKVFSGITPSRSRHRQSLVCLSRRHSVVKMWEGSLPSVSAHPLRRGASLDANAKRSLFRRQTSLDDIERETCKLEPRVDGRIRILTDELRKEWTENRLRTSVIPEADT